MPIRKNYYEGQNVTPTNLNDFQSYSDSVNSELVVDRFGFGVVEGFEITKTSDLEITVARGIAYAKDGGRLILENEKILSVNPHLPVIGTKKIIISIAKDYIKEDPVQDVTGSIIQTKWTPTVQFEITEYLAAVPEGYLELAVITMNSQGITEIEDIVPRVPIKADAEVLQVFSKAFQWNGQNIMDILYPTGYQYTQYPNDVGVFEEKEEPANLFGGVWDLQDINISMSPKITTAGDGSVVTKWLDGRMEIEIPKNILPNTTYTYPESFLRVPSFNGMPYNTTEPAYVLVNNETSDRYIDQVTVSSFRYVAPAVSAIRPNGKLSGYWKEYAPQNNAKVWKRIS